MAQEPRFGAAAARNGDDEHDGGADDGPASEGGAQWHAGPQPPTLSAIEDEFEFGAAEGDADGGPALDADVAGEGRGDVAGQRDARVDHEVESSRPSGDGKWPPSTRLAALEAYLKFCMDHNRQPSTADVDAFDGAFASANGTAATPTSGRSCSPSSQSGPHGIPVCSGARAWCRGL